MKVSKLVLFFLSICLFFNVAFGRIFSSDFNNNTSKKSGFLEIKDVKKSNLFLEFDLETISEETLEEESDSESDNISFDYQFFKKFDRFHKFIENLKNQGFLIKKLIRLKRPPLFVIFRNLRL